MIRKIEIHPLSKILQLFHLSHPQTPPDKPCDLCIKDESTFLVAPFAQNISFIHLPLTTSFPPIMVADDVAICRNTLDGLTDSPSRGANTHSHTPRGKQRNKKSLRLIYFYTFASFLMYLLIPLPVFPPSSLSVRHDGADTDLSER